MAERALHVAALILLVALGVAVFKRWQTRKAGQAQSLLALQLGRAAIIYFHSPSCGVCRTSQKPILDMLRVDFGDDRLQLMTVDVTQRADIASEWGVATVPSTFLIDKAGKVVQVNNGLTAEASLRRQLGALFI